MRAPLVIDGYQVGTGTNQTPIVLAGMRPFGGGEPVNQSKAEGPGLGAWCHGVELVVRSGSAEDFSDNTFCS